MLFSGSQYFSNQLSFSKSYHAWWSLVEIFLKPPLFPNPIRDWISLISKKYAMGINGLPTLGGVTSPFRCFVLLDAGPYWPEGGGAVNEFILRLGWCTEVDRRVRVAQGTRIVGDKRYHISRYIPHLICGGRNTSLLVPRSRSIGIIAHANVTLTDILNLSRGPW